MVIWIKFTTPVHCSSPIPKTSVFIFVISCLTTSNFPWFIDLTFQVPMQYCSCSIRFYFHHQTHPLIFSYPKILIIKQNRHFRTYAHIMIQNFSSIYLKPIPQFKSTFRVFYFNWKYYVTKILSLKQNIVLFLSTGFKIHIFLFKSSVQFSRSIVSDSLLPQHSRPPCPSPTPRVYSNSCPFCRWCCPTILSSVIPFSPHLQSFPECNY